MCEKLNQTVANILRTTIVNNPSVNLDQVNAVIDFVLSTTMHVTQCAVSRTLGISPGALVFRRDMFLDLPIMVDLVRIQQRRQLMIDENRMRQNKKEGTLIMQ